MEERRLLLAVILSVAILVAWQFLFQPEKTRKTAGKNAEEVTATAPRPTPEKKQKPAEEEGKPMEEGTPSETRGLTSTDLEPVNSIGPEEVAVDTDLYRCVISARGGGIKELILKKYNKTTDPDSGPVMLVKGDLPDYMMPLTAQIKLDNKLLGPNVGYMAEKSGIDISRQDAPEQAELTMWLETAGGLRVERKYSFRKNSYEIGLDISVRASESSGRGAVAGGVPVETTLRWITAVDPEQEGGRFRPYGLVAQAGQDYINESLKNIRKKAPFKYENVSWAGFSENYFLSILIPENPAGVSLESDIVETDRLEVVKSELIFPGGKIEADAPYSIGLTVYSGPKDYERLSAKGKNIEASIGYGMLKFIIVPLMWVLKQCYRLVHNWGLAIILLTVLVKILFFPLTRKSYESMKAMQALQPRIKEIQQKYKDDKEKMNQEMMALYRTHKVNPLGGCLPMLLQLPVLYALYRALYVSIELRHASFIWWINDLSSPETLVTLPIMGGVSLGVLPFLMGASMFVQQKMSTTTPGDQFQQKMFMAMPLVITVISFGFPTGLVLYWMISNLLTIIQQYVINRKGINK